MSSSTPPSESSSPSSLSRNGRHPQPQPRRPGHLPPSDASVSGGRPPSDTRNTSFPFSFIRPLQPGPSSSASLAPSTAEGKPIPVDDSTAEHRTSALRELNHNYPSRHRYAKSTGAQSSTYSEPVIVRSYYHPPPSRPSNNNTSGVVIGGGTGTSSQIGPSSTAGRLSLPFVAKVTSARSVVMDRMGRPREKKRPDGSEEAKLPPLEAFTFKSFMANVEAQEGATDINADLDRIAEICARSKYSLSNQYEVHYAPHGSGASFLGNSLGQQAEGPTLQVVSSDDEQRMRRQRRRRNGERRNSRAMGTLETIMSSSRSSDEDRTKKISAAEIAEEVRGRAARRGSGDTSPVTSSQSASDDQTSQDGQPSPRMPSAKRAASLALIDNARQTSTPGAPSSPRNSKTGLVGEPALPQASTSQLEIRTASEELNKELGSENVANQFSQRTGTRSIPTAKTQPSNPAKPSNNGSIFSVFGGWMSWRSFDLSNRSSGRAEGSLRELLRTTDAKGKGVERLG